MRLPEGTIIDGRFVVQALIGQGGTADVYGAYDYRLKLHRVLKFGIRPTLESARQRLKIEEHFLQECRHESLPACYGLLEYERCAYLVLSYCHGVNLQDFVVELTQITFLGVFQRILGLISIIHSAGYVYRDLKPSNIIVPSNPSEPWQLIDFDTVCLPGVPAESLGTPSFEAPEILSGSEVSPATDVFSIGRLLGHLADIAGLALAPPFQMLVQSCVESSPAKRMSVEDLNLRLQDLQTLLSVSDSAGCSHCFSKEPLVKQCCASCGYFVEIEEVRVAEAGRRLSELAESRSSKVTMAWIRDLIGGRGLSDSQRLELARWYHDRGRRADALQLLSDSNDLVSKPLELRLIYEEYGSAAALENISQNCYRLSDNPGWVKNASQILAQNGQAAEARVLLESAIKFKPDEGALYGLLAKLVRDPTTKAQLLESAIFARNPCVATLRSRAKLALAAGKIHESRALLEDALERVPGDTTLQLEFASVCLKLPSSWPALEVRLLKWLDVSRSDEPLEFLVDLYIRSERWEALKSFALFEGSSPSTRALVDLARMVALQDCAALDKLDRVRWNLAQRPLWVNTVIAALTLALRCKSHERAAIWLLALPETWDDLRKRLRELIEQ